MSSPEEPGGEAPDTICVFRTSSAAEAQRAAEALVHRGRSAAVDTELAPDAMMAEDAGGEFHGDVHYTVWVPALDADAAVDHLASLGFESAVDPYEFVATQKPWVKAVKKWVARVILLVALAGLAHWLWMLLSS